MRSLAGVVVAVLAMSACTATVTPPADEVTVELSACRAENSGTSPRLMVTASVSNEGEALRQVRLTVGFTRPGPGSPAPTERVRSRPLPVGAGESETLVISTILAPGTAAGPVETVECTLLETLVS